MINSYLITDPKFYSTELSNFSEKLKHSLVQHQPNFALYRDKSNSEYAEFAELFIDLCSAFNNTKSMLHADVQLAFALNAYGVHLTSQQFDEIKKAKALGLFTVISCHSERELLEAERLGADAATFSPIFATPNKGEPKGLAQLQRVVAKISLPIIALGGITTEREVKAVESTGCYGFASIRYFVES